MDLFDNTAEGNDRLPKGDTGNKVQGKIGCHTSQVHPSHAMYAQNRRAALFQGNAHCSSSTWCECPASKDVFGTCLRQHRRVGKAILLNLRLSIQRLG